MSYERRRQWTAPSWREATERIADGVKKTIEFQRRMIDAGSRPIDVGDAYTRFVRSDLATYGRRVTELTIDYYRALAEAARDYSRDVWDDVRGRGWGREQRHVREPIRHRMDVSGPLGAQVTRTFTLENTDETSADVTVNVGVCRGADGSAVSAPVTVDPDRVTIRPGASTTVTITTRLDPSLLEPDVEYTVPVNVRGPRPALIELHLRSAKAGENDESSGYTVRCPACSRTFQRRTASLDLRAHKTPAGERCPERVGRRG